MELERVSQVRVYRPQAVMRLLGTVCGDQRRFRRRFTRHIVRQLATPHLVQMLRQLVLQIGPLPRRQRRARENGRVTAGGFQADLLVHLRDRKDFVDGDASRVQLDAEIAAIRDVLGVQHDSFRGEHDVERAADTPDPKKEQSTKYIGSRRQRDACRQVQKDCITREPCDQRNGRTKRCALSLPCVAYLPLIFRHDVAQM
mmetsp:Transcript_1095/g.1857  ORF Transcript_1095/g.1857 Transcript_1095/m.1857 type:complete len:200 (+) Transcript_1095:688-1287(+)